MKTTFIAPEKILKNKDFGETAKGLGNQFNDPFWKNEQIGGSGDKSNFGAVSSPNFGTHTVYPSYSEPPLSNTPTPQQLRPEVFTSLRQSVANTYPKKKWWHSERTGMVDFLDNEIQALRDKKVLKYDPKKDISLTNIRRPSSPYGTEPKWDKAAIDAWNAGYAKKMDVLSPKNEKKREKKQNTKIGIAIPDLTNREKALHRVSDPKNAKIYKDWLEKEKATILMLSELDACNAGVGSCKGFIDDILPKGSKYAYIAKNNRSLKKNEKPYEQPRRDFKAAYKALKKATGGSISSGLGSISDYINHRYAGGGSVGLGSMGRFFGLYPSDY